MALGKEVAYQGCRERISALCHGETDVIANMASVVAVLHNGMGDFYWTGFYRVVDGRLVIGPYQGTVGCLRIDFGRGVCGTAAATGKTQVVPEVHAFPGHIACDEKSQSEIVVPVRNTNGDLIAVLDIDSDVKRAFDEFDREQLEAIMAEVFAAD
jgi:L-methionine (R)-S-oxide reductase